MEIQFQRNIRSNKKGIEFLANLWWVCKKHPSELIWDLTYTKAIDTNLLSMIGLIISRITYRGGKIEVRLRDERGRRVVVEENIVEELFEKYSNFDELVIRYRYINYEANLQVDDEVDRFLNKELKDLHIKHYEKIKLILSELIANIKMHTSDGEGAICGYINEKDNELIISVSNIGRTIKQNIEYKNNYKFENDVEALMWALKKTNTTREKEDSGGLGLYVLRKCLYEMNGSFMIASGKSRIEMLEGFFDINKIENISIKRLGELEREIELTRDQEKISQVGKILQVFKREFEDLMVGEKKYCETSMGMLHIYHIYVILSGILIEGKEE